MLNTLFRRARSTIHDPMLVGCAVNRLRSATMAIRSGLVHVFACDGGERLGSSPALKDAVFESWNTTTVFPCQVLKTLSQSLGSGYPCRERLCPFQTLLIVALTAACCVVAPLPAIAAEKEQITLEQIQAKAAKWRAAFVNIRVVYEIRDLPPLNEPLTDWPTPDSESAPRFAQEEWIWADHGLDLLETRAIYWTPGEVGYRNIDGFNGPKKVAFRASYQKSREEVEVLKELHLQGMVAGKSTSVNDRAAMHGLYWPYTVEWLPDILAKGKWKVEGVEPVFGDRCAKIAARNSILWLDLEHDCLPRRYQLLPNSIRKIGEDFVVDELQQLEGGLWFPKRARLQLQTDPVQNQLIVVTEAEINQSLNLARFDPPAPTTGTIVTDGRTGEVYTHGQLTTSQNQSSKPSQPTNAAAPLSAVPPAAWGIGWPITMVCVSITLLAVGLWLRRKESGE